MKKSEVLLQRLREQVIGRNFMYGTFLLAVLVVLLQAQVMGCILFLLLISGILVISDDIMPTLLPFLLACVFLSTMYDSYNTFIKIWWLAIPCVAAVVFHFIYYRKPMSFGILIRGLAAVSAALLLGGIGMISFREYFSGIALYYTLGLGVGMTAVYLLLRSQYAVQRNYDLAEYVAYAMYMMGFFACFVVLFLYSKKIDLFLETMEALELPSRNNYATFLMFAMPFPFYYAIQRKHHVLAGLFIYACVVLTGSRGGLLCGGVELVLCFLYLAYVDKKGRAFDLGLLFGLLVVAIMGYPIVVEFYASRTHEGDFFNDLGGRIPMAKRAIEYLKQNPLFGSGIGYLGNTDYYAPKKGALCWYHSMPFQIVGSMGLAGVVAYGYLFYQRGCLLARAFRAVDPQMLAFGVTYVGVLLMSCVNPGEFCPLPYEFLVILLFVLVELSHGQKSDVYNLFTSNAKKHVKNMKKVKGKRRACS